MNASWATGPNPLSDAATKASASPHTHSTTASSARRGTDTQADAVKRSSGERGTAMLNVAAAAASHHQEAPGVREVVLHPGREGTRA